MAETLGYLGPPGTFSEEAALRYSREMELCPFDTWPEIFEAVADQRVAEAIVPLENSCEGSVNLTLNFLAGREDVFIRAEVVLPVVQNLLALPEATDIDTICSHPQALAQCYNYLRQNFPRVIPSPTESTSAAARLAQASPKTAAIGTARAAGLYGLEVKAAAINDQAANVTRFVVLGREEAARREGGVKTSLVVFIVDRPGALYRILQEFAVRGLNLTRIESRPTGNRLGEYHFFIDLIGHREDPAVAEALQAVSSQSARVRLLGSYPAETVPFTANPAGLEELRRDIDSIDRQIVELLGRRAALMTAVARAKEGRPSFRDPGREEEVLNRLREWARREGFDPEVLADVYRLLFPYFVHLQGLMAEKKP
ncbi:MAG TPA: prephenate dehydratase [Spirochaetia bacterium]|nr:prephenate dehydratase [Spirochaetia bacterium]